MNDVPVYESAEGYQAGHNIWTRGWFFWERSVGQLVDTEASETSVPPSGHTWTYRSITGQISTYENLIVTCRSKIFFCHTPLNSH